MGVVTEERAFGPINCSRFTQRKGSYLLPLGQMSVPPNPVCHIPSVSASSSLLRCTAKSRQGRERWDIGDVVLPWRHRRWSAANV
jgi:hypothetical protein